MQSNVTHQPPMGFEWRRVVVAAGVLLVTTIMFAASNSAAEWGASTAALTHIAFQFSSAVAAVSCFIAARLLTSRDREAWLLIGTSTAVWFCGDATWTYLQLVRGTTPTLPHWLQVTFVLHPLLMAAGLLRLPKPAGTAGLTPRHIGNLTLIVCALAAVFVVTLWEPAMLPNRTWGANAVALLTASGLVATSMTAVYLLWSYRWDRSYWPLAIIVIATVIHMVTFLAITQLRMRGTYSSYGWFYATWPVGFGAVACAAYERIWQIRHRSFETKESIAARERWMEACVPAVLILSMLLTAWLNRDWLSERVAAVATVFAAAFALALIARDVWLQKEEQRLLDALNRSNDGLVAMNRELTEGENRYRKLNAELEGRVTARTTELQAAYRELESFSYAVAHDIKAPLRAINSYGALLMQQYADQLDSPALRYVQRMNSGALHVARLVDDLLAYAQVERLEMRLQCTGLQMLVDACLNEQRDDIAREKAEITADIEPLTVRVDNAAMSQTLRNLLQNALKFSSQATPPRISISARRHDESIRITVADNGIGFDMRYHDQIYAMFQRLHRQDEYPGTGIGLAIARKAIERMGGRMWAQSKPNEGATFYIELPAGPDARSSNGGVVTELNREESR